MIEHTEPVRLVVAADRFRRVEREAVQHREPAGKRLLVVVEELVAPRDRRFERLLPRHRGAAAAGEQPKAIVERGRDPGRVHHAHSCRRELDRERNAVETIDDLVDRRRRFGVGRESRPRLLRPLDEQRDRRRAIERRDAPRHLARNAHRLATRRQHAQARARVQQRLDHLGGRVEYLLAVVDHQQRVEIAQLFGQRVDERTPELLAQAEHAGDRLRDVAAVRDRGELRAPHAVGVNVELVGRRVQREAGLAAPAGTGQRHQPVLAHGLAHRGDLGVTADEARNLRGQVRRHRAERAQRRELVAEIGMHELPDPLGPAEILQPVQPQIAQLGAVGQRIDHQIARGVGDQRLPAVPDRAHARAPDDRRAEVVAGIAQANLAGVERHAHAHFATRGPRFLRERALHVERRGHGVRRPREGADHAVAFTLLDRAHAAVQRDGGFEQLVVTGDRDRRLVGTRLPELRRALDVGEQERHRAGRELGFDRFGTRPSLPGSFPMWAMAASWRYGPRGTSPRWHIRTI